MKVSAIAAADSFDQLFTQLAEAFEQPFSGDTLDDAPVLRAKLPFEVYFRSSLRVKLPVQVVIEGHSPF